MAVNDVDAAWGFHAEARKKVIDLGAGRETALPYIRALPGHEEKTAEKFSKGAYFLPVVARTLEAFGGLVFAKTPTRSGLEALKGYLKDITGSGQDIDRFAEQGFDAILQTGAVMVLADYPDAPDGATVADAEANGIRPTLKLYDATTILSARFRKIGAAHRLAHVRVLEEVQEDDPTDEFKLATVKQVRVLDLDNEGFYRQRVFRKISDVWAQFGETVEPKRQGKRLDVLPTFFSNSRDGEPTPAKPPLEDIADISIAHLNNSAALEWALLWTANPTPVFKGLNLPEGDTVRLGSSEGLIVTEAGDAKFMEFTGTGLSELRLALEAKRKDAALMGARMLLENGRAAIAAETARIERAGETAVVSGIANALSDCLTKALTFMADWAGTASNGIQYWLNTDLNPAGLSAQELTALLSAWQSGAITLEDLFENLQRAEIVDPAKSFDDHRDVLAEEGEALGVLSGQQPEQMPD